MPGHDPTQPTVETRTYPDRVLTDRHGYHQLLLGLGGALELESAGRLTRVTRGVLVPVASGEEHHYLAPNDNRVLVLDLPEAWCEALTFEPLMRRRAQRLPEGIVARGEGLGGGSGRDLSRWLQSALAADGRQVMVPRLKLLELLPAVRADLAHPWRVAEMARHCHLAEAAFARQFRALTGLAPHAWLARERLAQAREWLRTSSATLTEVALACGFADSAHFSRSFRRQHGVPPREWRQAQAARCQDSTSLAMR